MVGFSLVTTRQVNGVADDSEFITFVVRRNRKAIRRTDDVNLSSRNIRLCNMQVTSFDVRSRTPIIPGAWETNALAARSVARSQGCTPARLGACPVSMPSLLKSTSKLAALSQRACSEAHVLTFECREKAHHSLTSNLRLASKAEIQSSTPFRAQWLPREGKATPAVGRARARRIARIPYRLLYVLSGACLFHRECALS